MGERLLVRIWEKVFLAKYSAPSVIEEMYKIKDCLSGISALVLFKSKIERLKSLEEFCSWCCDNMVGRAVVEAVGTDFFRADGLKARAL